MYTLLQKLMQALLELGQIGERFAFLGDHRTLIYTVIFGLAFLLGFYIYKLYFSVTFFYLFVTATILLLSPRTSWQNTVATLSVVGVIFSFLSFRWNHVAAIIFCAVIGGMLGFLIYPLLILVILFALAGGALAVIFPVHSLCVFLPLFGALGLYEIYRLPVWALFLIILAGIGLQLLIARKQTMFSKPYPQKLAYWLEKRKAKHAAGV